jgi:predicted Zn-dependent protease
MKNLGRWQNTAWLLIVVLLLGTTPATGGFFDSLTVQKEKQIGEEYFLQIQNYYPLSTDPFVNSYINRLGQKLVAQLGSQPFTYRFFVIDDPSMNAMAVPGGYIFITTGFLRTMEREGELAGVLAHEISHISARHMAKQMDKSKGVNIATMVGTLAAVLLGGPAAAAIVAGTQAAGQSAMLKYSRDHEQEADSLGFKWMMKAGYNPRDMIKVFKKLGKQRWFEGGEIPVYLRTHPLTNARIVEMSHQYNIHKDKLSPGRNSPDFQYFTLKIESSSGNPHQLLRRMTQASVREPKNPVFHYGKALTLSRLERSDEAEAAFQQASNLDPGNIIIQRELAAHYFEGSRYQKALPILLNLSKDRAQDEVILYYLGRIYQEHRQTDQALAAMERVHSLNPAFVEIYHNLGTLYGEKGRLGLAHYYLGLHSLKARAYPTAMFHFEKALINMPASNPHYSEVTSQIARLKKMRVRVRD